MNLDQPSTERPQIFDVTRKMQQRINALVTAGVLFFSGIGCTHKEQKSSASVSAPTVTANTVHNSRTNEVEMTYGDSQLPQKEGPTGDMSDEEIEQWYVERRQQKTDPLRLSTANIEESNAFDILGSNASLARDAFIEAQAMHSKIISFLQ